MLRLTDEQIVMVPPLPLPDLDNLPDVMELAKVPAVRLFVERARAVRAEFALTPANAATIARICHRVDGLPLAIELAAARARLLPPAALLARLESRLWFLTGGPRDAPTRQQTMRAAVIWSHDLLTEEERALFRRLAVFVGGFTLEAAEAVAGLDDELGRSYSFRDAASAVLPGIASLVEKSLVRAHVVTEDLHASDSPRFEMLETVRELGLEQLVASGEAEAVYQRHAAYFLVLAQESDPHLFGPDQVLWLKRLEVDLPNLRLALNWYKRNGDMLAGMRLATALWAFWVAHDHVPEGRRWIEDFVVADRSCAPERAQALIALGDLSERLGDYEAAALWVQQALRLARVRGDRACEAAALRVLGNVSISRADAARNVQRDQILAAAEIARAVACLEESISLSQQGGDEWGVAKARHWLAVAMISRGDSGESVTLLKAAAETFQRLGDGRGLCSVLWIQGELARRAGALTRARALMAESLALSHDLGYRWHSGMSLGALAGITADSGEFERAAWLLGAAAALPASTGEPLRPEVQSIYDHASKKAYAALGGRRFQAAWESGAALPPDAAIAETLVWVSGELESSHETDGL